jgi:CubicO group peptidase (beta-lactamase class C family)
MRRNAVSIKISRRGFLGSAAASAVGATLVSAPAIAQSDRGFRAGALKADLERMRSALSVPGMAVVITRGDDIIFSEGFGLRNVAAGEPFTTDTMCLVASTTKSYTAGLIAALVDQSRMDWTKPVREYWPGFRVMDEFATRDMNLSDMTCHRSGLPHHENLLAHGVGRELPENGRAYRRDLLGRLAHFEPSHPFRSHFQYQDIIYTASGGILEAATGEFYEDLLFDNILKPLGMKDATFSLGEARKSGRLAKGYGSVDGKVMKIPHCDTRYFSPTAGLFQTRTSSICQA